MQRSVIMRATAAVAVLFGVPLLLAPNALLALYRGGELNVPGVYNSMLYGACLIGLGVMNWLAAPGSRAAAQPVIVGSVVVTVLGFVVAISRQLMDLAPPLAWINVALFFVLAVLYVGLLRGEAVARAAPASGA